MPAADELPESLAGLGRRQALELSPSRFETDTDRLLQVLEWTLADVHTTGDQSRRDRSSSCRRCRRHRPVRTPQPTPITPPARPAESPRGGGGCCLAVAWPCYLTLVLVAVLVFRPGAREPIVATEPATTSPDGLQLAGRSLTSPHDPPQLGDTVTVRFTLTNTTDQPIEMSGGTFVAARDPADVNLDTDPANVGTILEPGQSVDTEGQIPITASGRWQFWPCYESAVGVCPDYWTVFNVDVP